MTSRSAGKVFAIYSIIVCVFIMFLTIAGIFEYLELLIVNCFAIVMLFLCSCSLYRLFRRRKSEKKFMLIAYVIYIVYFVFIIIIMIINNNIINYLWFMILAIVPLTSGTIYLLKKHQ